jgi:Right handed beta helix region
LLEFGRYNDLTNDGGYLIRNLDLRGSGAWGVWLRDNVHHVTLENLNIEGFLIGVHVTSGAPNGVQNLRINNSSISRNSQMGILGNPSNSIIENTLFEGNNFSGSGFHHAIYMSGNGQAGQDILIRNNVFLNNSVVNGVCTGGNVTFHGIMQRVTLENNVIRQQSSSGGCYGFSITSGYTSAESLRDFVVRGNAIYNLGNCGVCASATQNILVENNRILNTQLSWHAGVQMFPSDDPQDVPSSGAIVRNNIACFPNAAPNQYVVNYQVPYSESTGNQLYQGAAAATSICNF